MDQDNPFSAGDGQSRDVRNDGDNLPPVDMDPVAILTRCWELMSRNPGTVAGAVLLPLVPSFGFQAVQYGLQLAAVKQDQNVQLAVNVAVIAISMVSMAVSLFLQLGVYRIFTRLVRGLPADISMLVGELRNLLPGFLATLLMVLAIGVGLLLLIVPGIVLALGLQFALYALIDKELDPIAALRESWRLTEGYKLTIFVVNLVIGILMLALSCVTLGVGYLLAIPMMALSQAVMYHSLLHLKAEQPMF